jgi:26S proteasome regulatory subunit N10
MNYNTYLIFHSLDNSEWSRNGDFAPSRWDSEQDAANIICEAKTQQNPENTLGIMAYAGRR